MKRGSPGEEQAVLRQARSGDRCAPWGAGESGSPPEPLSPWKEMGRRPEAPSWPPRAGWGGLEAVGWASGGRDSGQGASPRGRAGGEPCPRWDRWVRKPLPFHRLRKRPPVHPFSHQRKPFRIQGQHHRPHHHLHHPGTPQQRRPPDHRGLPQLLLLAEEQHQPPGLPVHRERVALEHPRHPPGGLPAGGHPIGGRA